MDFQTAQAFAKKDREIENLKRLNALLNRFWCEDISKAQRLIREKYEQKEKADKRGFYLILCNLAWCGLSLWHWF